jgi:hypothetical protein
MLNLKSQIATSNMDSRFRGNDENGRGLYNFRVFVSSWSTKSVFICVYLWFIKERHAQKN